jgi:hypothetical protein
MIDKEKPLDICKIEARNLVRHKVKHDNVTMTKALKAISKEADIPLSTLKKWIYPAGSENYNNKRRKKKVVPQVVQNSCTTDNGGTSGGTTSPVDSIVLTDPKLIKEIRSLANEIGISEEDVIRIGIGVYKVQ